MGKEQHVFIEEVYSDLKSELLRQLAEKDRETIRNGFSNGAGTILDRKAGQPHESERMAIRREIGRSVRNQTGEYITDTTPYIKE